MIVFSDHPLQHASATVSFTNTNITHFKNQVKYFDKPKKWEYHSDE